MFLFVIADVFQRHGRGKIHLRFVFFLAQWLIQAWWATHLIGALL